MMTIRSIASVVLMLGASASALFAQTRPDTGSIVRVSWSEWPTGRIFKVVSMSAPDTLVLLPTLFPPPSIPQKIGDTVAVHRAAITQLEIWAPRSKGEGVRNGVVVGSVFAGTFAVLEMVTAHAAMSGFSNSDQSGMGGALYISTMTVIGGTVGALYGATRPGRTWKRLDPRGW